MACVDCSAAADGMSLLERRVCEYKQSLFVSSTSDVTGSPNTFSCVSSAAAAELVALSGDGCDTQPVAPQAVASCVFFKYYTVDALGELKGGKEQVRVMLQSVQTLATKSN